MTNREAVPPLWHYWISHREGRSIARHHTNLDLSLARRCRTKLVGNGHLMSGLNIVVSLDVGTERSDEMKSGSRCLIEGVSSVWIRLPD
jgi:hypothetical protein